MSQLLSFLGIAVAVFVSAAPVRAESVVEKRKDEAGRFAVSVAITSGILIAQQNGLIQPEALDIVDPPIYIWINGNPNGTPPFALFNVNRPEPFLTSVNGSVNTVSPNVGANLEIMSPALDFLPADPRLFVTGEILPTFASDTTVALQGAATEFRIPAQAIDTFAQAAIAGTGSRLTAQVMTTVVAASAGAAFAFEFRERLLRVKPSVGWIRWGVLAQGNSLAAYKNDPVPQPVGRPFYGNELRLVEIYGRGSEFFNAIGPGLEVEMELGKRGKFRPVVFAGAFAYRTLGNQDLTFQGSSGPINDWFNDPNQPGGPPTAQPATYVTTWTLSVEDWSYRAAIGFRLRWVGD